MKWCLLSSELGGNRPHPDLGKLSTDGSLSCHAIQPVWGPAFKAKSITKTYRRALFGKTIPSSTSRGG